MLKKKLGKKALAFASAAVMAVSATATGLTALSMTAFAGEELGERSHRQRCQTCSGSRNCHHCSGSKGKCLLAEFFLQHRYPP